MLDTYQLEVSLFAKSLLIIALSIAIYFLILKVFVKNPKPASQKTLMLAYIGLSLSLISAIIFTLSLLGNLIDTFIQ